MNTDFRVIFHAEQ